MEVALRKGAEKKDVTFDRGARGTGNKVKRIEVDEITGETLDSASIEKGVREGDEFFPISPHDIDLIEAASQEALPSILVEEFVPAKDLPVERITDTYFVVPQKDAGSARGLKYLVKALEKTKQAGIAKFMVRSREKLGAVHAEDGKLILSVLAFAGDFAETAEAAATAIEQGGEVNKKAVDLSVQLIKAMGGDGTFLNEAKDEAIAEKARLIEEARQGKAVKPKKGKARPTPVGSDSIVDALAQSVENITGEKVTA